MKNKSVWSHVFINMNPWESIRLCLSSFIYFLWNWEENFICSVYISALKREDKIDVAAHLSQDLDIWKD